MQCIYATLSTLHLNTNNAHFNPYNMHMLAIMQPIL